MTKEEFEAIVADERVEWVVHSDDRGWDCCTSFVLWSRHPGPGEENPSHPPEEWDETTSWVCGKAGGVLERLDFWLLGREDRHGRDS